MESKHTCIYCKEEKLCNDFNKEHVFHKAFGTFGANTPTLINKVCKACNDYFAKTIDLSLRNTYEGNERFNRRLKSCTEYVHAKHSKNVTRIGINGDFKAQELVLAPSRDGKALECGPKNIITNFSAENEKSYTDIRSQYSYSPEVFRAIAKIAFNYLAHSNESLVLLQDCFDPIRNFIRNGIEDWGDFVTIDANPIIPDENGNAFSVHLITISSIGSAIFVSVSLYNIMHYKVSLTSNYNGQPIKTGYGEFFNPHNTGIKRGELGMS
jgi:hypothetical protein